MSLTHPGSNSFPNFDAYVHNLGLAKETARRAQVIAAMPDAAPSVP